MTEYQKKIHFRAQFGFLLREKRKHRRLTQLELGRMINQHAMCISNWETGRYLPNLEHLMLLAFALDVSPNSLLPKW